MSAPDTPISNGIMARVAAAPISWGICEVPGWGHQLQPNQVLSSMRDLGFSHTELGSVGFLPTDSAALLAKLDEFGLKLLGGFIPFVLHDADQYVEAKAQALAAMKLLSECGAQHFVSCAVSDLDDWQRPELAPDQWQHLYKALDELQLMAADHGLIQAFHPHVGAIVERSNEVEAVLENTSVTFTLDTAHLTLGGADPGELANKYLNRIALVHLKDVSPGVAKRLNSGEFSLMEAVQQGLFPPIGQGCVAISEIVDGLERSGKNLWYTLEQDVSLESDEVSVLQWLSTNISASLESLRSL